MCKQNKLKIFYLNVNGFFGDSSIKGAIYNKCPTYNKCCTKANDVIKACRNDQLNIFYADKIFDIISKKGYDLIFLSEIDLESDATKRFIEMLGEEYKIITPWHGNELKKLKDYTTCTICFSKSAYYTNEGNGFTEDDYLQLCRIKATNMQYPNIIGIHYSNKCKDSLKKFINFERTRLIVLGDTNANPDASKEKDRDAYKTNEEFVKMLKTYELNEINPQDANGKFPNTFKGITRIDRVFSILPTEKVTVEILEEFWEKRLSDHAALSITVTL